MTLNLGLRWDIAPAYFHEANQQSQILPEIVYPGQCGDLRHRRFHLQWPGRPGLQRRQSGLGTSSNPILAGLQFYERETGIGIGGKGGIPAGLVKSFWPAI